MPLKQQKPRPVAKTGRGFYLTHKKTVHQRRTVFLYNAKTRYIASLQESIILLLQIQRLQHCLLEQHPLEVVHPLDLVLLERTLLQ